MLDLSIVTTLYRSSPYLREFSERMSRAASSLTRSYEIILVNDGSPDDSLEVALSIRKSIPQVRIVDLSRNFGHHQAFFAGLIHAKGERVFLLDSDLEEDPELLLLFAKVYDESGADVVFGRQENRKGRIFERISGAVFYRMFNWLSETKLPLNMLHARLMSRRFVRALLLHTESEPFFLGLCQLAGFTQVPVSVVKHSRSGTSYTFAARLNLLVAAITSFSDRLPMLVIWTGLTLVVSVAAWATVFGYLSARGPVSWGPWIVSTLLFCCGIMTTAVGIMGIYASKTLHDSKRRPRFIVRDLYPPDPGSSGGAGASI